MTPHSRPRQGFILLFGTRNRISQVEQITTETRCPRCGTVGQMVEQSVRPWFTLFFIPIFPVGNARQFTHCTHCKASFAAEIKQIVQLDSGQNQRTITMYNSLRASPANSVTLNELMQLYAAMGEFDQAISAATEFPQALNNSEQCMATLGRIFLAKDDRLQAIQWFDAAIARNPLMADAHYYKATALLTANPPDIPQALAAARQARSAGHPQAQALIQEAQKRAQQ